MKIAFTICSNNYLAKAKIVSDTFCLNHPDYKFFVFLVDKLDNNIDYESSVSYEVVEIQKMISNIDGLALKYNIIELNTAVKASIFIYLFKQYNSELIIFLDPDVMIFNRFTEVEEILNEPDKNIVLTPHFCSEIDDGKFPSEIDFIPYGIFNLGFIAIKNGSESNRFLEWWNKRLMKYCFIKPEKGMFTDQLWVNYASTLFNGVQILKHLGYNVANWNLYERNLIENESGIYINTTFKLKFFHFSHYNFENPYTISKHQTRHSINDRPDIKNIFTLYQDMLIQNGQKEIGQIPCYYHQKYLKYHKELKEKADLKYYTLRRRVLLKIISILQSSL